MIFGSIVECDRESMDLRPRAICGRVRRGGNFRRREAFFPKPLRESDVPLQILHGHVEKPRDAFLPLDNAMICEDEKHLLRNLKPPGVDARYWRS